MSNPISQHSISKTYLKQFRINCSTKNAQVYVIDFSNKFNNKIQTKPIGASIFKIDNYYNTESPSNPFKLERFMGQEIEQKYQRIIDDIENDEISSETVQNLIPWLYYSKFRSPMIREHLKSLLNWTSDTIENYKHNQIEKHKKDLADSKLSRNGARQIHVQTLLNPTIVEELLSLFYDSIIEKSWSILKSEPSFPFWTNDNPGFSPNLNPLFAKTTPFHLQFECNEKSVLYYVLSPKYCLEIKPLNSKTNYVKEKGIEIRFPIASPKLIDYINYGTYKTIHKLLISNNKRLMERCIKWKKGATKHNIE